MLNYFAMVFAKAKRSWNYAVCATKKGHDKKDLCSGTIVGWTSDGYICMNCPYFKENDGN